jgi:tRNA threonylcarbamoyladenosine biosynthesis protein TsaE
MGTTYTTHSEAETKKISKQIYKSLGDKKLILLKGDLGVGKTVFVKGLAEAMKIKENITSPTFGIKNQYDGLVHYDLYLSDKKIDMRAILEEDMEDNIVIVE